MDIDYIELKSLIEKELSIPCSDKKEAFIQIRSEKYFKYLWNAFCKKYNYNSSALLRDWMMQFMIKKGAIKIVEKSINDYSNIDVEDMPLNDPVKKELVVSL